MLGRLRRIAGGAVSYYKAAAYYASGGASVKPAKPAMAPKAAMKAEPKAAATATTRRRGRQAAEVNEAWVDE